MFMLTFRFALLRFGLLSCSLALVACQTVQPYNGTSGYQIEQRNQHERSAILSYTLALKNPQQIPEQKLQQSCQHALQSKQAFRIQLLSQHDIATPRNEKQDLYLKHTRISTAVLNNPQQHNMSNPALDARPSQLTVLKYRCVLA